MSQALYRKYRPQTWNEVIGQDHVVQTLQNSIAAERVSHAYLFAGPRGTGKTTMARLLAKAVNCLAEKPSQRPCNKCDHCKAINENRFLDLIEIDAASNTSVDDVRDLRDKINFTPTQGRYKVYIIDEVHMLSTNAFNALLKTLEEPPPHAIFVLATTEIHKLPATVISRCQRHEFRRVAVNEIVANLTTLVKAEDLQAEKEALTLIARQASGSIRDAQSLLDQLASTGKKVTLSLVQTVLGTATSQTVLEVINAVRGREPAAGLEAIHRALDAGVDSRSLARQIVEYLRGLMLIQMGNEAQVEAAADIKKQMQTHAGAFTHPEVLRMVKAFNAAATDLRGGWQPSLNLELAVAELIEAPEPDPAQNNFVNSPTNQTPEPTETKSNPAVRQKPAPDQIAQAPDLLNQEANLQDKKDSDGVKQTSVTSPSTTTEIIKSWKQVVALINKDQPNLAALLNSVRTIEMHGNTLVLGFASQVLVEKMEKAEHLEMTRSTVKKTTNADPEIRCVVTTAKGKLPPNIQQDGMVATALNQGGEIIDLDE